MNKMHVKAGDSVQIMDGNYGPQKDPAGKVKYTTGKVKKVFPGTGRVIVEGVNMVKKHQKPRGQGMPGGIIEKEAAISASKVMIVCPKCDKPTRVGHKFTEGDGKLSRRKVRICKHCSASLD